MNYNKLLKTACWITLVIAGATMNVQAQSPAQGLSDYVNAFTGDFKYNVPLLTLSGPNGEKFPLNLNYSGGIRMNQEASWVGLGWNLNIGEIRRQVKGMPDDFNNVNFKKEEIPNASSTWQVTSNETFFGPLYFDQIYSAAPANGGIKKLDMYSSGRGMPESEFAFTFPDYDAYAVSGPGIGGEMRPFLFDYAEYPAYPASEPSGTSYVDYYTTEAAGYLPNVNSSGIRRITKKPIFRFLDEPMAEVKNHLGVSSNYNYWIGYKTPEDASYTPYYYNRFPDPQVGDPRSDWYNRSGNLNVFDAVNHVEYFTNSQIYAHHTTAGPQITGFLDYETVAANTSDRDDNAKYDPTGIGAFKVTTANGMTYHYSLPVYMKDETITQFELNEWSTSIINNATRYTKYNKYAYTWKLTAITDYRYEDTNGNNYPDEGDKGFWIRINYTKWSENYNFRSPYYGYNADASSRRLPSNTGTGQFYNEQGSVSTGNSELYYPEYIKTSTQTAYFIKGVRNDDHSVADASGNYTPKLYLKNIVLMDNDDVADHNIFAASQAVTSSLYPALATLANTTSTLSTEDYSYYQTDIENYALRTIDLEFDYDLSQKLYNNVNNNFTETPVVFGSASEEMYRKNTNYTTSVNANLTGKLTLKSVSSFELNHKKITPEHLFEYNDDNPDYKHEQQDIYGFYKDDYNPITKGRYITTDHDMVDAWSLSKITTPLGAEIKIDYESDRYSGIAYDGENGMPYKPSRVFKIAYVDLLEQQTLSQYHNTVDFSEISVNNRDIEYYYPIATKKYLYFKYHSPPHCDCPSPGVNSLIGYYSAEGSAFNLSLFPGSNGTPSKLKPAAGTKRICNSSGAHCDGSLNGGYDPVKFTSGFIDLELDEVYGGGTRVKTISIKDPVSLEEYELNYLYEDGLATTEPDIFAKRNRFELKRSFATSDRHAMAPSVGYGKVTVIIGSETDNIGNTEYTYVNTDPFSITVPTAKTFTNNTTPSAHVIYNYSHFTLQERRSLYGWAKSVTNRDSKNNIVSKSTYQYGDHTIDPRGKVDELFYDFFKHGTPGTTGHDYYYKRIHWKQTFTTHLKKEILYKDGITTSIEYTQRDNFTGTPTEIITTTPTMTTTKSVDMAYPSYPLMGAKSTNSSNTNLLVPIKEERFKTSGYATVIGGSSSNWSNSLATRAWDPAVSRYNTTAVSSIWSPTETFTFNGETGGSIDWKKTGSTSLFAGRDGEAVVERKDMKDLYSATKYGYDDRYKIAEVSNCNYTSFAYANFESLKEVEPGVFHFDGEVEKSNGIQRETIGLIKPHTGIYMAEVPAGQYGPLFKAVVDNVTINGEVFERGIQVDRTYRASVWVHKDSPNDAQLVFSLDGNQSAYQAVAKNSAGNIQIGDWIQMNLTFTVPANYVSSGGSQNDVRVYLYNPGGSAAYFDDLVVHPVDAQFTGYVYDERLGLVKAVINNENFYSRYTHDDAGTVNKMYQETQNGEKVMSTSQYDFK